jgi:hypothetical protein
MNELSRGVMALWGIGGVAVLFVAIALGKWALDAIGRRRDRGVESRFNILLSGHKAELDRQLTIHKAQLDSIADAARFDYQRRLADVNIYAARRHEAIGAVYKSLLDAEVQMSDVERFVRWDDVQAFRSDVIAGALDRAGVSPADRDEVRAQADSISSAASAGTMDRSKEVRDTREEPAPLTGSSRQHSRYSCFSSCSTWRRSASAATWRPMRRPGSLSNR